MTTPPMADGAMSDGSMPDDSMLESITITRQPDGSFQVTEKEDGQGEAINQAVTGPQDVMQLVEAFLTDNDMPGPGADDAEKDEAITGPAQTAAPSVSQMKQAWNSEAMQRDPQSGLRK